MSYTILDGDDAKRFENNEYADLRFALCQAVYVKIDWSTEKKTRVVKVGKGSCNIDGRYTRQDSNQSVDNSRCVLLIVLDKGQLEHDAEALEKSLRNYVRDNNQYQGLDSREAKKYGLKGVEWTRDAARPKRTLDKFESDTLFLCQTFLKQKNTANLSSGAPSFAASRTPLQNEISDLLDNCVHSGINSKVIDTTFDMPSILISLPTGTGKEPLVILALIERAKKLGRRINVLWFLHSPKNDIVAERQTWKEPQEGFSIYERNRDKFECTQQALDKEWVKAVIVSLPATKTACKANDVDDTDAVSDQKEKKETSNAIKGLLKFVKEHGKFDNVVADESHSEYDTRRTGDVVKSLKAGSSFSGVCFLIRKSATDLAALSVFMKQSGPYVHTSLTDINDQMVRDRRWPTTKVASFSPVMKDTLEKLNLPCDYFVKSKNPRDWGQEVCRAFIETLLKKHSSNPYTTSRDRITSLYDGNTFSGLMLVSQVCDAQALLDAFDGDFETVGNVVCKTIKTAHGRTIVIASATGTTGDRVKTEKSLNSVVSRCRTNGWHCIILTCGSFCQGNNIPDLDAAIVVGTVNSIVVILQFFGRLLRSRYGILEERGVKITKNDNKYLVFTDHNCGQNFYVDIVEIERLVKTKLNGNCTIKAAYDAVMNALPTAYLLDPLVEDDLLATFNDIEQKIIHQAGAGGAVTQSWVVNELSNIILANAQTQKKTKIDGMNPGDTSDLDDISKPKKPNKNTDDSDDDNDDNSLTPETLLQLQKERVCTIMNFLMSAFRTWKLTGNNLPTNYDELLEFVRNDNDDFYWDSPRYSNGKKLGTPDRIDLSNREVVEACVTAVDHDRSGLMLQDMLKLEFNPPKISDFIGETE